MLGSKVVSKIYGWCQVSLDVSNYVLVIWIHVWMIEAQFYFSCSRCTTVADLTSSF